MTTYSQEQMRHDRINLGRLIHRLDRIVNQQRWESSDKLESWASATSIYSTVRYAKDLLAKLQENSGIEASHEFSEKLENLDQLMQGVQESLKVTHPPSAPLLMKMKPPKPVSSSAVEGEIPPIKPEEDLLPAETADVAVVPSNHNQRVTESKEHALAPSPFRSEISSLPTLVPSKYSTETNSSTLSTSLQTQEELSLQLSQMATQLKRNALHFADSLAKEKGLLEGTQNQLEGNLGSMKSERIRLRDHGGKSSSTTWMVLGSIASVVIAWVLMFVIIRLT